MSYHDLTWTVRLMSIAFWFFIIYAGITVGGDLLRTIAELNRSRKADTAEQQQRRKHHVIQ